MPRQLSILSVLFWIAFMAVQEATAFSNANAEAHRLFDRGDYLEAARQFRLAVNEFDDSIAAGRPMTSDWAYDYLMALSNEINCRYMLDDYNAMQTLADRFDARLSQYSQVIDSEFLPVYSAYRNKNLGSIAYGMTGSDPEAFTRAESHYLAALAEIGPFFPEFTDIVCLELAQLYYKWGLDTGDASRFRTALSFLDRRRSAGSPEAEPHRAMIEARIGATTGSDAESAEMFSSALSRISSAIRNSDRNSAAYPELLRRHAKILMLQSERTGTDNYRQARQLYEKYAAAQRNHIDRSLASMTESERRQAWIGYNRFLYDCCRLGPRGADLAYDIALYSKGYLLRPAGQKVPTFRAVGKALSADECAIEFLVFDNRLKALYLDSRSKAPEMLDIASVDSILAHEIIPQLTVAEAIASDFAEDKDDLYRDPELPAMIWTPELMKLIGNHSTVFFAPDGLLHQLAVEYMLPDSIDGCRVSSTARVIDRPAADADIAGEGLFICGGVDYHSAPAAETGADINDETAFDFLAGRIRRIDYLPGSKRETDSIAGRRHNPADTLLTASMVTEHAMRTCAPRYRALHISTHGYYGAVLFEETDLKERLSDDALSQSGLMLSGAQRSLVDSSRNPGSPDGILSAAEIASFDWSRVGLAILSACQSGLGFVTPDGVFGLQRGLKMSGVDAMIVSLWSVDDAATDLFMRAFYDELSEGRPARTAFRNARRRLLSPGSADTLSDGSASRSRLTGARRRAADFSAPRYSYPFIAIDLF